MVQIKKSHMKEVMTSILIYKILLIILCCIRKHLQNVLVQSLRIWCLGRSITRLGLQMERCLTVHISVQDHLLCGLEWARQ